VGAENLKVLEPRRAEPRPGLVRLRRLFGRRFRRLALLAGFLGFVALLFPRDPSFEVMRLREGFPAQRDIIAPYQFYVLKDRDRLRDEQVQAGRHVSPVYSVDPEVAPAARAFLDSLKNADPEALAGGRGPLGSRLRALNVSPETMRALSGPEGRGIVLLALRVAGEAYAAGVLSERGAARADTDAPNATVEQGGVRVATPWGSLYDLTSLRDLAWDEGQRAFPGRPEAVQALEELVAGVVTPNLRYEASATEALRAEARSAVDLYDGLVRKDEKIIGSHEIATAEHIRKIESLRLAGARMKGAPEWRSLSAALFGRLALLVLLLLGYVSYLRHHHREIYADTSYLLLLSILAALVLGVGWIVVNQVRGYEMLIPVTVLSLAAALLFGHGLAFVTTLMMSLLTGVVFGLGLPFLSGSALAGIAAIATATEIRRRRDFYRPMLVVALAYVVAAAAMGFVDGARWEVVLRRSAWGVVAGFASVFLVTVLLPILESAFSVTTDITLLELADLNRPILRRLMLEAPGTYHHSLVVGSLAEAGAAAIGGNPLLARVDAYYHDVGKIEKAEYYVENQAGARSPHEKIKPTMSCLIIESHIREGVEIAGREKLPRAIVSAILEHHGTTLMSFFYNKAKQKDPEADEREFRYPGPKPRSKETAVLMLADAVEAAARSLTDPTPSRIRGVVTRILEARVKDGQLDESPVTFEDLAEIRERFIPILTALFHARVHYPGGATEERPRAAADERNGRGAASRRTVDHS
jgi:putative nucleotidyltransferase with HDIG domain